MAEEIRQALERPDTFRGQLVRGFMGELGAVGFDPAEMLGLALAHAQEILRAAGYIVVRRAENDRGSLYIQGVDDRLLPPSECPVCGKAGHVYYHEPSLESWSWEVPYISNGRGGGKRGKPRWLRHGTYGAGDDLYVCAWCDAAFPTRELYHAGPKAFDEEVAAWMESEKANGRVVVVEGDFKLARSGGGKKFDTWVLAEAKSGRTVAVSNRRRVRHKRGPRR
jgi:hypothetical protein